MRRIVTAAFTALAVLAAHTPVSAQLSPSADWAAHAANNYQVAANLTYLTASNYESKLDIYHRRGATTPQPTVLFFHGGFWAAGAKENSLMSLIPWMEMGWNVVNVEYRLARVAPAPAAVEDALCALRYAAAQAKTYNIDVNRIVVTGESAGGHLALASALIPESAGLDRQCAGATPVPRVAAAINWYGVTDVGDVIEGPNRANAAVTWLGSLPDRMEIARRVSPLTYVRQGLPPVLSIHGDMDTTVPYQHAVRLHDALTKAGVPNQLLTIPGGRHGNFTTEERTRIFVTIQQFLAAHELGGAR
ncbi:MAG TPA: alpha/beta hydrolase [Vicinamibacterales bacterium]|nr:alpha/beta hydrolase [Vicinamibacterales bacterium]